MLDVGVTKALPVVMGLLKDGDWLLCLSLSGSEVTSLRIILDLNRK